MWTGCLCACLVDMFPYAAAAIFPGSPVNWLFLWIACTCGSAVRVERRPDVPADWW